MLATSTYGKVGCVWTRGGVYMVRALGHANKTGGDAQTVKGVVFACVPQGTPLFHDFCTNEYILLKACVP